MSLANLKNNYSSVEEIKKNFGALLEGDQSEARVVVDDEGIIIYSSQNFVDLCDAKDDVDGLRITDLIEFDTSSPTLKNGELSGKFIQTNKQFSFELNWVVSQKKKILIISAHPFLEYKQTERVSPFVEMSFDAQVISNTKKEILETNQKFIQLFGDFDGKKITDFIHADDQKLFSEFFENDSQRKITTRANGCNGNLWIMWAIQKREEKAYILARDITERENHRYELEAHKEHINEAEAIASMGQWEWVVGHEEISFSEEIYRIFGLDSNTQNPTLDDINDMIHEDDDGRMMQVFQRAIIEQNNYDMDFKIQLKNGETRYIKCEGRCRVDDEDDVIALYGIMQDVTETMKREHDLVKAKESVEKAYAAKTQFLANMSHELRTPLNAVIGFSEMMERQLLGPIGNEKYLDYISGIRKSGEHLLSLISDILDMSKIEAGKYDLAVEDFNVSKTARLAVHMIEGRALNENVKIIVNIDDDKINMRADRRAVMQILLNILSNAVKFSKKDGQVTIEVKQEGSSILASVKDYGIGIPANKLATITQPFEQVENQYSRQYEGTGLGLSITKELVEIHGGTVEIDSTINVGTTVFIKLPQETIFNA